MKKIAIVYWSGTGNTEAMAECIAEGVREAGAEAELMGPAAFSAARFAEFSAVAFGCPAMGSEVLEEADFEPMFAGLEGVLGGKRIALFGSYGWGALLLPLKMFTIQEKTRFVTEKSLKKGGLSDIVF